MLAIPLLNISQTDLQTATKIFCDGHFGYDIYETYVYCESVVSCNHLFKKKGNLYKCIF